MLWVRATRVHMDSPQYQHGQILEFIIAEALTGVTARGLR